MTDDNRQNEYLYKMSSYMRAGLAEVQAKVNDLYRVEELDDYIDLKDSPIEYIQAALLPLIAQVNDFQDYAETVTDKMELNLEEVDIYAALEGVMTFADQLVESKPGQRTSLAPLHSSQKATPCRHGRSPKADTNWARSRPL